MKTPLFTRIDTVFLPVSDLDRAIEWYSALLGWQLGWRTEAAATLQAGGIPLTLLQYRYPGVRQRPAGFKFQPVGEVAFNLFAPDLESAHRRLKEAGVEVSDIEAHGVQREFRFRDPDGNVLGACWWPE